MSRSKFEAARGRRKRSKGDGEIHELVRPITNGNYFWARLGDATRVVLLLGHAIDDVLLLCGLGDARFVNGAYYVDLIILPQVIVAIDVHDVVCAIDTKYRIGRIPVYIMHPRGVCGGGHVQQAEDHEGGISLWHVGCRPTHPF